MTDPVAAFLGRLVAVRIDRPLGSSHPHGGWEYPVNYGYVPGVFSGDGEELDAYVLGVSGPLVVFEGRCIAVIRRAGQDDDKLVVVPDGRTFTADEVRALTRFQERDDATVITLG